MEAFIYSALQMAAYFQSVIGVALTDIIIMALAVMFAALVVDGVWRTIKKHKE